MNAKPTQPTRECVPIGAFEVSPLTEFLRWCGSIFLSESLLVYATGASIDQDIVTGTFLWVETLVQPQGRPRTRWNPSRGGDNDSKVARLKRLFRCGRRCGRKQFSAVKQTVRIAVTVLYNHKRLTK